MDVAFNLKLSPYLNADSKFRPPPRPGDVRTYKAEFGSYMEKTDILSTQTPWTVPQWPTRRSKWTRMSGGAIGPAGGF